ncbi:uncharacterized protein DDB_G0283357-like [Argopecten irradians]|uniref:uncharacterized protein DDB_G0283357-like n=1 Tax=Argopecten irradians TaxID=31199 RepID=UPI00370FE6EA
MVPPRYRVIILCLFCLFIVRTSCAITNTVDGRSSRFNRTTVRQGNTGGNSIQTFHASNRNNHIAGITNGKSVGIGGIIGAKESKVIGNSLRQGLRKVLPFGNSIQQNSRVGTTVNNAVRKNNLITRQTKGKQHGKTMATGGNRAGVGNTGNKISSLQRKIVGRPSSITRGRSNKMVNINSSGQSNSGNGGHGNANSGGAQHLSRNVQMHSKIGSANNLGHGKSTNHGSATGMVRNSKNTVHSKFRKTQGQTQAPRAIPSNTRSMTSNSRGASQRTPNVRTMSSSGSSKGRSVSMSNTINHGNAGTSNGNTRTNMGRTNGLFHTNNGAIQHSRNSGRFNNRQNIIQRTPQRTAMGHSSFPVSSGMQSNIRRRNGGIPRGISSSGKRVVVQNGRRIIVSPSRFSMRRQHLQTSQQRQRQQQVQQQQIRIVGDSLEGGLENLDIDNIIGLASKIASVKLANSVLSSVGGQEGTPQLSRFLINSELDIVPELIMTAPRQIIQAQSQVEEPSRRVEQAPRRIITINQRAPISIQSQSPQTATNELQVAPSGYGMPVLVRSGGAIQFSRVDQNGKEISSLTISKGKQTDTINNANSVKQNSKSTTATGNGNGNGGTSKQAPEKELEMEMEQEGLTTTTPVPTKPTKPLLPPTTTVANSVILV